MRRWTPPFTHDAGKYLKCQWGFDALLVQCRPGSHILNIKKYGYALFYRLKSGRNETIKTKQ